MPVCASAVHSGRGVCGGQGEARATRHSPESGLTAGPGPRACSHAAVAASRHSGSAQRLTVDRERPSQTRTHTSSFRQSHYSVTDMGVPRGCPPPWAFHGCSLPQGLTSPPASTPRGHIRTGAVLPWGPGAAARLPGNAVPAPSLWALTTSKAFARGLDSCSC